LIILGADDKGDPGWDEHYGWGRINAQRSLELIQNPDKLMHAAATSGYTHSVSDTYAMVFYGVPGLYDGVYFVKRNEIRKNVTFDEPYLALTGAWDRGSYSRGYSAESPNYGQLYSSVVSGSVSATGLTTRTYVYQVWDFGGDYVGWFPCSPSQATMAYSVLGEYELDAVTSVDLYYPEWVYYPYIYVEWQDLNEHEDGFVLERKGASTGVWETIDTLPPSDGTIWSHYYDYSILGSETYTYRVKPYTAHQPSVSWSPEVEMKARPMPPENVQCYVYTGVCCPPVPSNMIRLSWSPPPSQLTAIDHYAVFRRIPPGWMGTRLGPFYDTIVDLCPSPAGLRDFFVYSFDSEGDSSVVQRYCSATAGTFGRCNIPESSRELADVTLPGRFSLSQNYPNPFNSTTTIQYELPQAGNVRLVVIDILGRTVKEVVDEYQDVGPHSVEWNGADSQGETVASGVYFYRLTAANHCSVKRMALVK
jgi:hypothetical protein